MQKTLNDIISELLALLSPEEGGRCVDIYTAVGDSDDYDGSLGWFSPDGGVNLGAPLNPHDRFIAVPLGYEVSPDAWLVGTYEVPKPTLDQYSFRKLVGRRILIKDDEYLVAQYEADCYQLVGLSSGNRYIEGRFRGGDTFAKYMAKTATDQFDFSFKGVDFVLVEEN